MNFNTLLEVFGFTPDDFIDLPIQSDELDDISSFRIIQKATIKNCIHCNSTSIVIKDYYDTYIRTTTNVNNPSRLVIRRVRMKCKDCNKTFSHPLNGYSNKHRITKQVEESIIQDFTRTISFSEIAKTYSLDKSTILKLFDRKVRYIPGEQLPEILCIDEIKFSKDPLRKYVCVLSDFNSRRIVDIIESRRLPFLKEYFSNKKLGELKKVKYFITDMYDGYARIHDLYFPKSIHIIDLFHVIKQLRDTTNHIRVVTMNSLVDKEMIEYRFMKKHWEYFLIRRKDVPYGYFVVKSTGETASNDELIQRCLKLNKHLWDSYECLQELYFYKHVSNFEEAHRFLDRVITKLRASLYEDLHKVADTYNNWRYEIANAFDMSSKPKRYTNGLAEGINNKLKTLCKISYGFGSFDRFRKRALLISNYDTKKGR